jgi:hypothetical protein
MMWLKGCPKCHGDLYESRDYYGRYVTCLQCGHHLSDFEEITLGIGLTAAPLVETFGVATPDLVASAS